MKAWSSLALAVALAGCGASSSSSGGGDAGSGGDSGVGQDSGGGSDSGGGTDGAGGNDGGGMTDGPLPEAGAGTGTVSGSADGTPFTTVASALWLGAPDDPATTVVYIFSKSVACSDLQTMGWDKRISNATQFLEMKMFGTTAPTTFTATTSLTPAPGEATVNYTLSTTMGTPVETGGTGGTVTLTTRVANTDATGSFALHFGTNNVMGTYDAVFCPGGHEP